MGKVIKHHSDQQDGHHSAIKKMISDHQAVMGTRVLQEVVKGFRVMGHHFSMVHGHLASSSKRLDALEQRLTEFHKTVELRLEGMSFDQARQDYDRCEARAQTDQKLDLILKYMAGFDCEMSEMKTKVKDIDVLLQLLDVKIVTILDSMLLMISTKLGTPNLEIANAGQDAELTHV